MHLLAASETPAFACSVCFFQKYLFCPGQSEQRPEQKWKSRVLILRRIAYLYLPNNIAQL